MHRRDFIQSAAAIGAASLAQALPQAALAAGKQSSLEVRLFEVTTEVDISRQPKGMALWLPLFHDDASHQKVIGTRWHGNAKARAICDDAYRAPILHATWSNGLAARQLG